MRHTSRVLWIAVDNLIPPGSKSVPGLDDFTATLDHRGIPAVWLTCRSRLQFDDARRKYGHIHPFVAEGGCAVYLPEDYFHLRPDSAPAKTKEISTLRLGRFICIPIAQQLPAVADALEALSNETAVPVVTLRSLPPRELSQNTSLPRREAELARQRDFDDVFFFAGASDKEIEHFLAVGRTRGIQFRQSGVLWSAAIGASFRRCIEELSKLYDRALRHHAHTVGVATADLAPGLFPFCKRTILLIDHQEEQSPHSGPEHRRSRQVSLHTPDFWEQLVEAISAKD